MILLSNWQRFENLAESYKNKFDYRFDDHDHFAAKINLKWAKDSEVLPLTETHYDLYKIIHYRYARIFGDFPDIISGKSFNEKMQWLKLFDQRYDTVRCSDKIEVKNYSIERVGTEYILPTLATYSSFEEIKMETLPASFAIKPNHDSGSSIIVRDKKSINLEYIKHQLNEAIEKVYGWENGEWAYRFVPPQIFIEPLVNPSNDEAPPDYKFFCCNGKVKFVQYIYDRHIMSKEIIVDSRGNILDVSLYFDKGSGFSVPERWNEMLWVAERLSSGFKFVRVDLYTTGNRIYVGEMTFWPMFGMYQGDGQKILGNLLNFNQQTFLPPIIHELDNRRWR